MNFVFDLKNDKGNLLRGIDTLFGGFHLVDLIITELKSHMTC